MVTNNALSPAKAWDPNGEEGDLVEELYTSVQDLPSICPQGHVDPAMFTDESFSFGTSVDLFIIPDHYIFRMLYSQGIPLEALGIPRADGGHVETDHMWRRMAAEWVGGLQQQGLYYRYWMQKSQHNVYAHYGIRTRRYKLIYYYPDRLEQPGAMAECHEPEWELFDLQVDPHELHNLIANPAYAGTVQELRAELRRLQAAVDDTPYHQET